MDSDIQARLQQALGKAYVIERELGGGGMSRVFVADEAALGRKVVVKVLRPELAEALSGERFKREVRLAARLQHPHIVPLLAAGEIAGGVLFYTMPFVEGESLRQRLEREAGLPVGEVVRILCDVAGALAYAHRNGVVHRDVKPENILLSDGRAVVADFGIAKAISASRDDGSDGDTGRSSTLTAAGTSLGTPMYMAPEQAVGGNVDHRADLYALGVVGYEMLAGRAPFEGRSAQQLLAAHAIQAPEPIARQRPSVPAGLGGLIMQLLEKNPADRPQSADEVRRALDALPSAGGERALSLSPGAEPTVATPSVAPRRINRWAPLAALAGLIGLTAWAMLTRSHHDESPSRSVVGFLPAPAGQALRPDAGLALSPDGARLAFVAEDKSGTTAIWVRSLDSLAATRVDGTDNGAGPFWSPDGASLGYFAGGQLRVSDLRSGTRRALCPAPRAGGGAWTAHGVIVYSPDFLSVPLFQVRASGGSCTQLTHFRPGESVHRRPSVLPDDRHILFNNGRTGAVGLDVADLSNGRMTHIEGVVGDAQFVPPDWVLFRDGATSSLYVQRLDLEAMKLQGEPRLVLERVGSVRTFPSYTATATALVAFQMNTADQSLIWVNRRSVVVDSVRAPVGPTPYFGAKSAALDHGGRRIAFAATGPLWIYDRDRNVATRAHTGTVPGQGILEPAWDPGDSLIAYRTLFAGTLTLRLHHVATDTSDSLFAIGMRNFRTPDWSPDGRQIVFQLSAGDSVANDEIWIYSLDRRTASRAFEASGNLSSPRWSPDGRWLAYVSDETGGPEVYLRSLSAPNMAARVSTAGGEAPYWRGDGRELYYRTPDGAIMAVNVRPGPRPTLSAPSIVLADPPFSRIVRYFQTTPDGERFVAFAREEPLLFTLVTNWKARVAVSGER